MTDIALTEPTRATAGDRWRWRRNDLVAHHPASSWTLTYYFSNSAAGFSLVAAANGEGFEVDAAPATTASYAAGRYRWSAVVSKAGDRSTVGHGEILVADDPATAGAFDYRAHPQKVLDAIEAVIEGRASKDQASYKIAGRELVRTPIADLLVLKSHYAGEVERTRRAARLRNTGGRDNLIRVRLHDD